MSGFRVLLSKELREQLRTFRLPMIVGVFMVMGLSSPALARYLPELISAVGGAQSGAIINALGTPTAADAVGQLLKNIGQIGILVAILLAMGSVSGEKSTGTAALVLTKPASRAAFLAAKLTAITLTLGVATAIGCAFGYLYTGLLFDTWLPVGGFALMALLTWVSLVFYAALTFLGSTLTRSSLAGAGLGIVFLVVSTIFSIIPTLGEYIPQSLGTPAAALALGRDAGSFGGPLAVAIGLIGALYLVSWWSFRRQEL